LKEVVERETIGQIVEQGLYRHPRAFEDGSTAQDVGINRDEITRAHVGSLQALRRCVKTAIPACRPPLPTLHTLSPCPHSSRHSPRPHPRPRFSLPPSPPPPLPRRSSVTGKRPPSSRSRWSRTRPKHSRPKR